MSMLRSRNGNLNHVNVAHCSTGCQCDPKCVLKTAEASNCLFNREGVYGAIGANASAPTKHRVGEPGISELKRGVASVASLLKIQIYRLIYGRSVS